MHFAVVVSNVSDEDADVTISRGVETISMVSVPAKTVEVVTLPWVQELKGPGPSRVVVDGNPVKLTSHEYRLLSYLMHHQGRVVSRTELVEHLYDQDFDRDSNTIEVFVGRLRKKLGVDIIQTVRGLGYIAAPPEPAPKR